MSNNRFFQSAIPHEVSKSQLINLQKIEEEKKALLTQFVTRQLLDHVYDYSQKNNSERINYLVELLKDYHSAPPILQHLTEVNGDKINIRHELEYICERLLNYFITLDQSELNRAIETMRDSQLLIYGLKNMRSFLGIGMPAESTERLHDMYKSMLTILFISTLCTLGKTDLLQLVISKQSSLVNCEMQKTGKTPLHWAIELGKLPLVNQLIELGADVNKNEYLDPEDRDYPYIPTPLSHAVYGLLDDKELIKPDKKTLTEIIDSLLKNGADPKLWGVTGSAENICRDNYQRISADFKPAFDKIMNWKTPVPMDDKVSHSSLRM